MNRFKISSVDGEGGAANSKGSSTDRVVNNGEVQLSAYNLIVSSAATSPTTLSPPTVTTSTESATGGNGVATVPAGSGTNMNEVMQRKFSIAQYTRLVHLKYNLN